MTRSRKPRYNYEDWRRTVLIEAEKAETIRRSMPTPPMPLEPSFPRRPDVVEFIYNPAPHRAHWWSV